ncbi:Glyoxalase/bleomycin resistance protein/dioxygenase superfamily protein [Listeria floridensis FSL S10-1187]|uniref:Glyoxalase/bleomycin resistance protein/dioxygenase superfamily protein n=1 Tax=Listeria floridensis FSL S10-1187 TaxID=1265817 RepID=A0ABN0RBZ6_9LIST|nr:hypothetical protein [Listeria floridensis]EUJ26132.1 Glyoxalase/bleomycin resistance protein/dioxygenase superfamily protein [Listeria floridensis FSL S10-1187]
MKKTFEANRAAEQEMPDGSLMIKLDLANQFALCLFNQDFIKKFSPEVSLETPSIMLFSTEIEKLHAKISEQGFFISPISDEHGQKGFNFADPEGHYFAVSEAE